MLLSATRKPRAQTSRRFYEVVVGNVGTVYRGSNRRHAEREFRDYVHQSKHAMGRADGESVTIFADGEVVREYVGKVDREADWNYWSVRSLDVWGNAREGYWINQEFHTNRTVRLPEGPDADDVIVACEDAGEVSDERGLRVELGESEIVVSRRRDDKFLVKLVSASHEKHAEERRKRHRIAAEATAPHGRCAARGRCVEPVPKKERCR